MGIDSTHQSRSKSPKTNLYINKTNAAYHHTQQPGWTQNCIEAKAQIALFRKRLRHLNVSVICWIKFPSLHKKIKKCVIPSGDCARLKIKGLLRRLVRAA